MESQIFLNCSKVSGCARARIWNGHQPKGCTYNCHYLALGPKTLSAGTPDGYTLLVKGYFDLDGGAFFYNQRFLEGLVVLQLEGDLIFSRWKRDLGRRGLRVRLAVYQYLCAPWRCVYLNKNLVSTTTKEPRAKVRMRVFCFRQIQWFQSGRKAVDLAFVQIYVGNRFLTSGFAYSKAMRSAGQNYLCGSHCRDLLPINPAGCSAPVTSS